MQGDETQHTRSPWLPRTEVADLAGCDPPSPPAEAPPALVPGRIVDRYLVEECIGTGGIASVFRVRHATLGTVHALKVLDVPTPAIKARVLREARAQCVLRHPNVVAVTDVFDVDGSPGILAEYVDGGTLADLLLRGRPALADALALGTQVLRGVAAVHGQGLVHRDLKPSNILIARANGGATARVADFGLVKLLSGSDGCPRTRSGLPMGTPGFMAPEQVDDASAVDARADVFALGALLYALVTGRLAFEGNDPMALFDAARRGAWERPRAVAPDVPAPVEAVLARALDPDPAARFADAGEMLRAWTEATEPPQPQSNERNPGPTWWARVRDRLRGQ